MNWIDYVLGVCIDQVRFMTNLLAHDDMHRRIAACLSYEQQVGHSDVRMEALHPLNYSYLHRNSMDRVVFKSMMPVSERLATSILSALLDRGLLKPDSPRGKVRFAIPYHSLRFYFPSLWPEAEDDPAT